MRSLPGKHQIMLLVEVAVEAPVKFFGKDEVSYIVPGQLRAQVMTFGGSL